MDKTFWKQNFFSAIAVGVIGGLATAAVDIVTTIIVDGGAQIATVAWYSFLLLPSVVYTAGSVILMTAVGSLLLLLIHLNGFTLESSKKITAFYIGLFTLFFINYFGTDILTRYGFGLVGGIQFVQQIHIATTGMLAGIGSAIFFYVASMHLTVKQKRTILLGTLIVVIALILLLLPVLAQKAIVNSTDNENQKSITESINNDLAVPDELPNILWIVMDTTRADFFSSYGYPLPTTPNLDALANEGTRYTNAISQAAWTLPSHASMFTSLYPSQHNTFTKNGWLASNFKTVAETLQQAGYQTAGLSNNDFISAEKNFTQGFDNFVSISAPRALSKQLLLRHRLRTINNKTYERFSWLDTLVKRLEDPLVKRTDAGAATTNVLAEQFIASSTKQTKPFFLFINYMEAHGPYGDTPGKSRFTNSATISVDEAMRLTKEKRDNLFYYFTKQREASAKEREAIRLLYAGDLWYLDKKIGELIDAIETHELLDDTLIIVTADHGENLGERNLYSHAYDIHHTLTHVPLIIRHPKYFKQGAVNDSLVELIDIYPTILEVANIQTAISTQGQSILGPQKKQRAVSESWFDLSIMRGAELDYKVTTTDSRLLEGMWRSVHTKDYEYIQDNSREEYLYDRQNGDTEKNIIERRPEVAKRMRQLLGDFLTETAGVIK